MLIEIFVKPQTYTPGENFDDEASTRMVSFALKYQ